MRILKYVLQHHQGSDVNFDKNLHCRWHQNLNGWKREIFQRDRSTTGSDVMYKPQVLQLQPILLIVSIPRSWKKFQITFWSSCSFSGQNYVQSDPQQRLVKLKVGGRAKVFRQGFQKHRFNYRKGCPESKWFFHRFSLLNRVSSQKWYFE